MIRALVVGMLGGVLLCSGAATAAAPADQLVDPVFDPEDAQDLANLLADATEAQHICYGWAVRVFDQDTGSDQQSTGSNFGPERSLDSSGTSCRFRVEFTADIVYTSSTSESADSASWSVISTPQGPDTGDLDRLGLFEESDLVGDDADAAVARAVAALPQLAADSGIAPAVTAAPASSTPPDVGSLTDDPGSDYLRRAGGLLAFGAVLLVGGVAFGVFALRSSRARQQPSLQAPFPSQAPPP
ncbi:MAG: hypothetical protein ABR608_02440, partial [Pseudonocardiaceae bacterium]